MCIYFVLTSIVTGLCMLVLPSSNATRTSVSKALFNYTHWTLIWTILFIYSIELSTFSVFFGQLFKRRKYSCFIEYIIYQFLSFIGQIFRFYTVGLDFYWFLSWSTSRRSIYNVSISQYWSSVLFTSCSTIWTQEWLVCSLSWLLI
jgi:hypothetical protein